MISNCPFCLTEVETTEHSVRERKEVKPNQFRNVAFTICPECGWVWATDEQRRINREGV